MKWHEIRKKYPNKFILLGDIVEENISKTQFRVLEANILEVSDSGQTIRQAYQKYKKKGLNILYSLPSTPEDFIVENIPVKGILR